MRRRHVTRIDSPDTGALRRPRWRARILQVLFTVLAIALLAAAAANARNLDTRDPGLLPRGTTGVVVIDLSLSITDADYTLVRRVLKDLAADDARIGLVIFSDIAYELLPPGTPSSELQPVLRLLESRGEPQPNPWTQSFRAGTRISSALELAAEMLERDAIESPSILLVSDLETAPDDVPSLARTIAGVRARSIPLRVSGLGASSDARKLFGGLLEEGALTVIADTGATGRRPGAVGRLPTELLVLAALLFAALAVHERFTARLALPPAGRGATP